MAGNDAAHLYAIVEEMAQLLLHSEFIAEWKEGAALVMATARVKEFLSAYTLVRA